MEAKIPHDDLFSHDELAGYAAQRTRENVHAVVAEATDDTSECAVHRSAAAFVESVEACTERIANRRAELDPESNNFYGATAEALDVAEVGFRNGRTAALRALPGEDPGADSIEDAAFGAEAHARQYSGHVPDVVYHGDAELCSVEHLWDVYERSVSAGIRSVRRAPFGEDGPVVFDTLSRGFDVESLLAERLRVEPRSGGRRAYDLSVPMGFVEELRPMAGDVRVASQFVWSYSGGTCGPLPYTEQGVSLLRAHNEKRGTRYEAPDRVVRFVEA